MIGAFDFEHGGRTYRCSPEQGTVAPAGRWWWFTVTHDRQRYAPFEAASNDTRQSVQDRIVAYYERLLWVRAQPPVPRHQFARPGRPPASAKKAG